MVQMKRAAGKRLAAALIPRIDIASDAIIRIEDPVQWQRAVDDLRTLLSDPLQWSSLAVGQREGAKKPLPVYLIGRRRWAWLKDFYTSEIAGEKRATG